MIAMLAAAAAAVSVSGGTASVRVDLSDLNKDNVKPVIMDAAARACRALGEPRGYDTPCVQDAAWRALVEYRVKAKQRTALVIADRR